MTDRYSSLEAIENTGYVLRADPYPVIAYDEPREAIGSAHRHVDRLRLSRASEVFPLRRRSARMTEPRSREELLGAPLASFDRVWLEVHCARCTQPAFLPCKLVARERGERLRVVDVLPRLRCRWCGGRPKRVLLVDFPCADERIYADRWKVVVFEE